MLIFLSKTFFGHPVVCGKFYSNDLMQGARNWAIIGIGQHLLFWSLDGAGLINNILPVFVLTNYDCWQISIFVSLLSISLYITFNSWHCYSRCFSLPTSDITAHSKAKQWMKSEIVWKYKNPLVIIFMPNWIQRVHFSLTDGFLTVLGLVRCSGV